jgi:hypothetical protein
MNGIDPFGIAQRIFPLTGMLIAARIRRINTIAPRKVNTRCNFAKRGLSVYLPTFCCWLPADSRNCICGVGNSGWRKHPRRRLVYHIRCVSIHLDLEFVICAVSQGDRDQFRNSLLWHQSLQASRLFGDDSAEQIQVDLALA